MTTFALLSTLVTLAALFGLVSSRVFRLPRSIGTTILSLAAAAALIGGGRFIPTLRNAAAGAIAGLHFDQVVLHGFLAFLLFAGALQIDLEQLAREKLPVLSLSLVGTSLSVLIVSALFKYLLVPLGIHISFLQALLFGALISPTDPAAVLDMLRRVGAPAALESQLAGESLFNDGIGAVIFLTLLAASQGKGLPSPGRFSALLLFDSAGAIALGIALGYVTYRLLRLTNSYRTEVMLTLALAMGGYSLADNLHLSAPLEVVAAGLMVNGRARVFAMSKQSRQNVDRFWELLGDIVIVMLFLLLGFELLVVPLNLRFFVAGLLAIPAVLAARWASVSVTVGALAAIHRRVPWSITILTWGGLRGALAVALALSLPEDHGMRKNLLLATYVVVVFSIVVQGLTIPLLVRRAKNDFP